MLLTNFITKSSIGATTTSKCRCCCMHCSKCIDQGHALAPTALVQETTSWSWVSNDQICFSKKQLIKAFNFVTSNVSLSHDFLLHDFEAMQVVLCRLQGGKTNLKVFTRAPIRWASVASPTKVGAPKSTKQHAGTQRAWPVSCRCRFCWGHGCYNASSGPGDFLSKRLPHRDILRSVITMQNPVRLSLYCIISAFAHFFPTHLAQGSGSRAARRAAR